MDLFLVIGLSPAIFQNEGVEKKKKIRRPLMAFRFVSFIKKENIKLRHHLQNLSDTINRKSSLKS